jgi:lysozyme
MGVREINQAGLDLIKGYERPPDACVDANGNIHPYLDPVKVWTIGWGHAISSQGQHVVGEANRTLAFSFYPDGLSAADADATLRADLATTQACVQQAVTTSLSDNEFAALVSFTFNVGAGHLRSSTLLKYLNDDDRFGAANQFGRWVLGNGEVLPGLVARRRVERDLFLTPDA